MHVTLLSLINVVSGPCFVVPFIPPKFPVMSAGINSTAGHEISLPPLPANIRSDDINTQPSALLQCPLPG